MTRRGSDARRLVGAALLVPWVSGCFGGHLFALGRRRSEVRAFHETRETSRGVIVRTTTLVTDDHGRPLAEGERWIAIGTTGAVRDAGRAPEGGAALVPTCDPGPAPPRPCVEVLDGGELLRIRDGTGATDVLARRLTRTWTEPWVYTLLPGALVLDVLAVPFFVVMSPAALLIGD